MHGTQTLENIPLVSSRERSSEYIVREGGRGKEGEGRREKQRKTDRVRTQGQRTWQELEEEKSLILTGSLL